MRLLEVLALVPLAVAGVAAHNGGADAGGNPVIEKRDCMTQTETAWATERTGVALPDQTITVSQLGDCQTVVARRVAPTETGSGTDTVWQTTTSTVWVTAAPTVTETITAAPTTTTKCYNRRNGGVDLPEGMTNGERLRRGLPLRSPIRRRVKRGGSEQETVDSRRDREDDRHQVVARDNHASSCLPVTTTVTSTTTLALVEQNTQYVTTTYCNVVARGVAATPAAEAGTRTITVLADSEVTMTVPCTTAATATITPTATDYIKCKYPRP